MAGTARYGLRSMVGHVFGRVLLVTLIGLVCGVDVSQPYARAEAVTKAVTEAEVVVDTVWGKERIQDKLLKELIASFALQRLKEIDQSGPPAYFCLPRFSRYEHSVGVLALLIRAKVSLEQQVAGLLHDASHTAFSHLGDMLFYKSNADKSYQDLVHLKSLRALGAMAITRKKGICDAALDPDCGRHTALEQPLPDLCADRIQYVIHTGVILGCLTPREARAIVDDLRFDGKKWTLSSPMYARKLGLLSLVFTRHFWGAPFNLIFYETFTKILRYALKKGIVTRQEIQLGRDSPIMNRLKASTDPHIAQELRAITQKAFQYHIVAHGRGTYNLRPKFRGIDPLVRFPQPISKSKGKKDIHKDYEYKRLTAFDRGYAHVFSQTREWCHKGYGITLGARH